LSLPLSKADRDFIEFIGRFKRSYGTTEEYEQRRKNFLETWQDIKDHNATKEGYTKAINKFADWSDKDWKGMMGVIGAAQ
jgi:hypothetical protein